MILIYKRELGLDVSPNASLLAAICADIAVTKYEHWSSLAPLPFEVVISAGQKAREETWDGTNFFYGNSGYFGILLSSTINQTLTRFGIEQVEMIQIEAKLLVIWMI